MTRYGIQKTITYDLYAEVEADSVDDVYEMLDNDEIEFTNQEPSDDEVVDVFEIEQENDNG